MFDFIKLIFENHGEIKYTDNIDPNLVVIMKMNLLAFPVLKNDVNTIVMPSDIYNYLKNIDFDLLEESIELNELVTTYTHGLVECYGYFEVDKIFYNIEKFEGYNLDIEDFYLLLNNDGFLFGYDVKNGYLIHYQVKEISNFFEKRKQFADLDYYHPTKKEIIKGFSLTEFEEDILYFYENNLEMPRKMAVQGLYLLKDLIRFDYDFSEIKPILKKFDISLYQYKQLEKLVEVLYFNTRLWTLKGNTRNEIKIPKLIKFKKVR